MSEVNKLLKLFYRDTNDLQMEKKNVNDEIKFSNQRKFNSLGARLYKIQTELDREHAIDRKLKGLSNNNKRKDLRKSFSMPATMLVKNANKGNHDRIHGFSKYRLFNRKETYNSFKLTTLYIHPPPG